MEAALAGSYPYPGVQFVLEGAPASLELEFLYTNSTLRGVSAPPETVSCRAKTCVSGYMRSEPGR
jgi:hypothetical protein